MSAETDTPVTGVTRFPEELRHMAAGIRLIGLDSDGTLTDRGLSWDSAGQESRRFDVRDGLAMQWAMRFGLEVVVISGRNCRAVDHRMTDLGVPLFQGARDKIAVLEEYCGSRGIERRQVAFLGDDLPDLPALRWCALPLAVADAHPLVVDVTRWRSRSAGGHGAAREAIEAVLEATGRWQEVLDRYAGGES